MGSLPMGGTVPDPLVSPRNESGHDETAVRSETDGL